MRRGYRRFLCGMALGFDMAAAEAVLALRAAHPEVRLVCVVPFAGQDRRFPAVEQERYRRILEAADETVVLRDDYRPDCYARRNDRLTDGASAVVAWYDGSSGGTHYTVRRARRLGLRVLNLWQNPPGRVPGILTAAGLRLREPPDRRAPCLPVRRRVAPDRIRGRQAPSPRLETDARPNCLCSFRAGVVLRIAAQSVPVQNLVEIVSFRIGNIGFGRLVVGGRYGIEDVFPPPKRTCPSGCPPGGAGSCPSRVLQIPEVERRHVALRIHVRSCIPCVLR